MPGIDETRRVAAVQKLAAPKTQIATAMSGTALRSAEDPPTTSAFHPGSASKSPPASGLARASLCALCVTLLPACLVTSSPSFEEPERTSPFLVGPTARPDLRQVKVVDSAGEPDPVEFSAIVRSEDNGTDVLGRLVLDYGVRPPGGPGYPYQQILRDVVVVEASTLDDTSRTLSAQWFPGSNKATNGCHTVTLFATHEIDFNTGCPADPSDFDYLTWTVIACDSTIAPCCDPTLPPGEGGCTSFVCPTVAAEARCDVLSTEQPNGGTP